MVLRRTDGTFDAADPIDPANVATKLYTDAQDGLLQQNINAAVSAAGQAQTTANNAQATADGASVRIDGLAAGLSFGAQKDDMQTIHDCNAVDPVNIDTAYISGTAANCPVRFGTGNFSQRLRVVPLSEGEVSAQQFAFDDTGPRFSSRIVKWVDGVFQELTPWKTMRASDTTPLMDGTATVGTELHYARGDHAHPSDAAIRSNSYRQHCTNLDTVGYITTTSPLFINGSTQNLPEASYGGTLISTISHITLRYTQQQLFLEGGNSYCRYVLWNDDNTINATNGWQKIGAMKSTVIVEPDWANFSYALFDTVFGVGWQSRLGTYHCRGQANSSTPPDFSGTYAITIRVWVGSYLEVTISDTSVGFYFANVSYTTTNVAAYFQRTWTGRIFPNVSGTLTDIDSATALAEGSYYVNAATLNKPSGANSAGIGRLITANLQAFIIQDYIERDTGNRWTRNIHTLTGAAHATWKRLDNTVATLNPNNILATNFAMGTNYTASADGILCLVGGNDVAMVIVNGMQHGYAPMSWGGGGQLTVMSVTQIPIKAGDVYSFNGRGTISPTTTLYGLRR